MIQQEEDSPQALSDKDIETVDNYIQSLERTNPKLAEIIRNLWKEVQAILKITKDNLSLTSWTL